MNYKETAECILNNIGGISNVENLTHCATRLRFTMKDVNLINDQNIKNMKEVIATIQSGDNYQVVIGNEVGNVYDAIMENSNFIESTPKKKTYTVKGILKNGLDVLSSCMVPLVPAIVAAGMLNVVISIIKLTQVINVESQTFKLIQIMANSCFYFLPILVAITAAKRFKCSPFLAVVCVGVLIHPDFISLVATGEPISLFGLPVAPASYTSQLFPAVLTVWFMSVIEHTTEKIIPKSIKYFTKTLLVVFITSIMGLIVLAPIGYYISELLANIIMFVQDKAGWLAVLLLSFPLPLLVMTGTHKAIAPIAISLFATQGYDALFLVSFLGFNFSQGAAALAVALKTKNPELKQTAFGGAIAGLVAGITEPALYGISLKYKKPLYASMIGSACAGLFSGIVGVKLYTYVGPSLISMPAFIGGNSNMNFIYACISALIAISVTMILTWKFGWGEKSSQNQSLDKKIKVHAPVSGNIIPIKNVKDELFSSEVMGKSFGIIPNSNDIVSPIDGEIVALYNTKHAIGIKDKFGLEILIHIGIDTAKLNGKHFTTYVKKGDIVSQGQKLIHVDFNKIKKAGYDSTVITVITNSQQYTITQTENQEVNNTNCTILLCE